jgi:hypothetical protein
MEGKGSTGAKIALYAFTDGDLRPWRFARGRVGPADPEFLQ